MEKLITLEDLCQLIAVTPAWVYERTKYGSKHPIPFVKVGHFLRFRPSDIEHWLIEQNHHNFTHGKKCRRPKRKAECEE